MNRNIKIYVNTKEIVFYNALSWFNNYGIPCEVVKFSDANKLTRSDIVQVLSLTERGFSDLIKKSQISKVDNLSFNEAVVYLINHPSIMKNLFIISDTAFMAGFDSQEIRRFLPRDAKKLGMEFLTAF